MKNLFIVIVLVFGWALIVELFNVPSYAWPSPYSVAIYVINNKAVMLGDVCHTATSSLIAVAIIFPLTLFNVVLSVVFSMFGKVAFALFGGAQAIPVLAVAPFLSAWFGPGVGAQTAAAVLVAAPVAITTAIIGAMSLHEDEVWLASSVFVDRWRFASVYALRRFMPMALNAMIVAAPLCVLGAIVGEFTGSSAGLGFRILTGSYYLRTDEMVSAIIFAITMSISFASIFKRLREALER